MCKEDIWDANFGQDLSWTDKESLHSPRSRPGRIPADSCSPFTDSYAAQQTENYDGSPSERQGEWLPDQIRPTGKQK